MRSAVTPSGIFIAILLPLTFMAASCASSVRSMDASSVPPEVPGTSGNLAAAYADPAVDPARDPLLNGSEGHLPASLPSAGRTLNRSRDDSGVVEVSRIDTSNPVFFITIDDGLVRDPEALRIIEFYQLPVTAFLTEFAVRGHGQYFKRATEYGGTVENHTMTHAAFDDPTTDVRDEICRTQQAFAREFGELPTMLRPPYGVGYDDSAVVQHAAACGVRSIVMWDVVARGPDSLDYVSPPLRPGDIVLLHWSSDLARELVSVLKAGARQGLSPAALRDYL